MAILCVILLVVTFSSASGQSPAQSPAQSATPSPVQQKAINAWNSRDWPAAVDAYQALIKADTTQPLPHLRLGVALIALGKYAEARQHIATAERRGVPVPQAALRMALADAGSGKLDDAFTQLKRATDAGLGVVSQPDDSLAAMQRLKQDSRYATFVTDMDRNLKPCMYDPKHNEFDFWVGTWEVRPRVATGGPAAKSVITKMNDGCVVHESWNAVRFVGQSFNIWDRTRQKWFQTWVDNSGGMHEYSGTFSDNTMRYEGEAPGATPAVRVKTKMTFFKMAGDTVRQLGESARPDGTWAVTYDLIYTRAKEQ